MHKDLKNIKKKKAIPPKVSKRHEQAFHRRENTNGNKHKKKRFSNS